MTAADYLIIGGGVAGTTAAETIRASDQQGSIAIVDAESYRLYSRVLLPHYVKGLLPFERLFLRSRKWYQENQITLKTNTTMVSVDPIAQTVDLSSGETVRYDKLLLATGGTPMPWGVPGGKSVGVTSFWTLADAERLRQCLSHSKVGVIVGGGFIMTDLVSLFRHYQLTTHVLIRGPHVFRGVLDETSAGLVEQAMERNGVAIHRDTVVAEVAGAPHVTGVITSSGNTLACDIVALGIGLQYDFSALANSGLTTERGIQTNEYLETTVPNIYAAGDVAEFFDVNQGIHRRVGNWTNSQEQGKVAGLNMTGDDRFPFTRVTGYSVSLFGMQLSFIGDFELREGMEVVTRGDPQLGKLARLLLCRKRLIGATLINSGQLRQRIIGMIESRDDMTARHATLGE